MGVALKIWTLSTPTPTPDLWNHHLHLNKILMLMKIQEALV